MDECKSVFESKLQCLMKDLAKNVIKIYTPAVCTQYFPRVMIDIETVSKRA